MYSEGNASRLSVYRYPQIGLHLLLSKDPRLVTRIKTLYSNFKKIDILRSAEEGGGGV